jgi:mannose-6-phosphate isomerase-like protein (cupin superfamily)
MSQGYFDNIEKITQENDNFRQVLHTGEYSQLVVMSLLPGEEIGAEVHNGHDQFFRIESGQAKIVIGEESFEGGDGFSAVVPSGVNHNVINISETEPLKLYTIYSPSEHAPGTIHKTKAEAEASNS